jgi:hypothetical protein
VQGSLPGHTSFASLILQISIASLLNTSILKIGLRNNCILVSRQIKTVSA